MESMTTTVGPTRTADRRRWRAEAERRRWQPSTTAYCCPRELTGARCRHRPPTHEPDCLCDELRQRFGALNHTRRWTNRHGWPVITAEPYWSPDDERIVELRDWCAEHGIELEVAEYSPYYPGHTTC
jgi:hypothetical protein